VTVRLPLWSRLTDPKPGPGRRPPALLVATRVVMLAALSWGVAATSHAVGTDRRVALAVLIGLSLLGYLAWTTLQRTGSRSAAAVALLLVALGGGALGAFSGLGIAYLAVVGIAAGDHVVDRTAIGLLVAALASLAVAVASLHDTWELVGWGVMAGAGGLMAGQNRRQYRLRAEQSEQLLRERERTGVEAAHAAALAERNRIAREVHDVLAHSLGALAVQLETLDALLDSGDIERARSAVGTSRRLAVEGLDETRRAVHALRDAPLALAERVAMLAAAQGAVFRLEGSERSLQSDGALAVYRAAQEALTNAGKHAPGAAVLVVLSFLADRTTLTVSDEYPDGFVTPDNGAGAGRGPGYGLTGMRERLELLGGSMTAGPAGGTGWRVAVELPDGTGRASTSGVTVAEQA